VGDDPHPPGDRHLHRHGRLPRGTPAGAGPRGRSALPPGRRLRAGCRGVPGQLLRWRSRVWG
jgi:hypothetical protein